MEVEKSNKGFFVTEGFVEDNFIILPVETIKFFLKQSNPSVLITQYVLEKMENKA